MTKRKLNLMEQREENLMKWVAYWRKNPQRFAEDYIGVKLFLYQKILLYMIDKVSWFMYIAARGQGKSYIIAVYCVIRCILYPNTRIVIASGTKGQAKLIISEKIMSLYNNNVAVREEIGDIRNIKTGVNVAEVVFLNGSKISAETSSDNSRGLRGNILIVDEFRMVDKDIIDSVLKPMLNVTRQPGYLTKPEYRNYPTEANKEIYISSAWYKTHWIWGEFNRFLEGMLSHKSYFLANIPYQLSVHHGLLPIERVEEDRTSDTFDDTKFAMEYEALFPGENERGYFKLEAINKCRTITRTFIPPTTLEWLENKSKYKPKNLSNLPRINKDSEIRIIALDVALMGGNKNVKNDTSAFTCMRLVQEGESYRRDVVYLESINKSIETSDLAVRLKQLYEDFEADYVIVDTMGQGIGVFDALCKILYDEDRDKEYEPWAAVNDEAMNERFKTKGKAVIYSMKGTGEINNDIAVGLRGAFEKGKIKLPVSDIEKREELVANGGFLKLPKEDQQRQLYAYQQASALASELVALEYKVVSGNVKITEVGTATKDRYSSLAYANYQASEFEKALREENVETDMEDYIFITGYSR